MKVINIRSHGNGTEGKYALTPICFKHCWVKKQIFAIIYIPNFCPSEFIDSVAEYNHMIIFFFINSR